MIIKKRITKGLTELILTNDTDDMDIMVMRMIDSESDALIIWDAYSTCRTFSVPENDSYFPLFNECYNKLKSGQIYSDDSSVDNYFHQKLFQTAYTPHEMVWISDDQAEDKANKMYINNDSEGVSFSFKEGCYPGCKDDSDIRITLRSDGSKYGDLYLPFRELIHQLSKEAELVVEDDMGSYPSSPTNQGEVLTRKIK